MMDNDSSILLLTNGGAHNNGHTSFPIENTASSMQTDSDTDDADYTDDAEISSGSDESPSEEEGEEEDDLEDNELMKDDAREEGAEKDLNQEARDLAIDNDALEEKNPHGRDETNLSDTDKVYALRAAFPTAPVDICEKVLSASKGNLKTTYNVLAEGFIPQMSREAIIARDSRMRNRGAHHQQPRMLINPVSTPEIFSKPSTRKSRSRERSPGEDSNGEDNEVENDKHKVDLVKTYGS
jgi:hypothetical protein